MLGTTTLHNGMILSTLSISSHGFALSFPKKSHANEDVFLTYLVGIGSNFHFHLVFFSHQDRSHSNVILVFVVEKNRKEKHKEDNIY